MFLISLKFSFTMCGAFEKKKEIWILRIEINNIDTNDVAIENGQVHHWSLKLEIYMI